RPPPLGPPSDRRREPVEPEGQPRLQRGQARSAAGQGAVLRDGRAVAREPGRDLYNTRFREEVVATARHRRPPAVGPRGLVRGPRRRRHRRADRRGARRPESEGRRQVHRAPRGARLQVHRRQGREVGAVHPGQRRRGGGGPHRGRPRRRRPDRHHRGRETDRELPHLLEPGEVTRPRYNAPDLRRSAMTPTTPTSTPQTPPAGKPRRRKPGQSVVLHCVPWEMYTKLLKMFAEKRGVRLAYDRGDLEIMAPSYEHDNDGWVLGQFVYILSDELNLSLRPGGSTTLRRKLKQKGIEPDECFWIANAAALAGARRLNLRTHPPPDLAIEVDVSRSPLPRSWIHAALKVPALWRLDGDGWKLPLLG